MRSNFLTIAMAALLSAAILQFGRPAAAQESMALAIEGWQQQDRSDGVIAFRCASSQCAQDSVVSYKVQPHRPSITVQQFEDHHRGLAAQNKLSGRIRDVRISGMSTRTIDRVRVLQVSREVDWDDSTTTFSIEARLIGPERSFSLVSDSPRNEWTRNNFEGFLRNLVLLASVKGG